MVMHYSLFMRQLLTYLGLVLTIYAYITHLAGSW